MEIERARLTKQLAKLKEEEGKVDEAAEILQEVAVVRPSWSPFPSLLSVHQAQMAASPLHHDAGLLQGGVIKEKPVQPPFEVPLMLSIFWLSEARIPSSHMTCSQWSTYACSFVQLIRSASCRVTIRRVC